MQKWHIFSGNLSLCHLQVDVALLGAWRAQASASPKEKALTKTFGGVMILMNQASLNRYKKPSIFMREGEIQNKNENVL